MSDVLAPSLTRLLDSITVDPAGLRARVVERAVSADSVPLLRSRLATAVYEEFHQGRRGAVTAVPRTLRDPEVERALLEATPHDHTELPARLVADDRCDEAVVLLHGVRVTIPADLIRRSAAGHGAQSVLVRIPAARAALSPGFFLVHGSRGSGRAAAARCRVYLHVRDVAGAIGIWNRVLTTLEGLGLRYQAKVLSAPSSYPRRDAVVVYLEPEAWDMACDLASAVAGLDGLGRSVSPLCDALAPGVSRAREPLDERPGRGGLSFGEHRAGAIADGLLESPRPTGHGDRERSVAVALRAAGIDPLRPYLNTADGQGFPERHVGAPGK